MSHITDLPMEKKVGVKTFGFYSGYSAKSSATRQAKKWAYGYDSKIVKTGDGWALYLIKRKRK